LWTTTAAMGIALFEGARAVYLSTNAQNLPLYEGALGIAAVITALAGLKKISSIRRNNTISALEDCIKILEEDEKR
jgi:hypothetical protein